MSNEEIEILKLEVQRLTAEVEFYRRSLIKTKEKLDKIFFNSQRHLQDVFNIVWDNDFDKPQPK